MTAPGEPCDLHLHGPDNYIARAEWGERMLKTHKCTKCRRCGLYVVWTPKAMPVTP